MLCTKCGLDHPSNYIRTIFRQDGNEIFAYHIGKCIDCGADVIEKENFESEGYGDSISVETFLEENPDFSSDEIGVKKPSKLIIHETDCHGGGWVYYNKSFTPYSYEDETGDIRAAVEELIRLGFIEPEQVVIFEEEELYQKFAELLEKE